MTLAFTPQAAEGNGSQQQTNPSQPTGSEAGAQNNGQLATQQARQPEDIRQVLREVLTEFNREQQSQRDKLEARLNNRFNQVKALVEKSTGTQLTEEQQAKLRMEVSASLNAEESPDDSGGGGEPTQTSQDAGSGQTSDQAPNWQTALAHDVMKIFKVEIDEADPEADNIDWSSAESIMESVAAACKAKRTRQAQGSLPVVGGRPAPREPDHKGKSSTETLDMYFNNLNL